MGAGQAEYLGVGAGGPHGCFGVGGGVGGKRSHGVVVVGVTQLVVMMGDVVMVRDVGLVEISTPSSFFCSWITLNRGNC